MKKDEPTFTFSNYLASEQDIAMVTSTLSEFFSTDLMADIFFDKSKIEDTLVISYDSKSLYVWHKGKDWSYETFDHDLSIDDASHKGWRTNLRPIELRSYLPKQWQDYSYKVPKISGCFVTPFTTLGRFPYNSESSYKSTIIHELGHVFFNKYVSHAYLNKEKNLVYIDAAITVLKDGNNPATLNSITLDFPTRFQVGELFAFCVEYVYVQRYHPEYAKVLTKEIISVLENRKERELSLDSDTRDSILEFAHDFSFVFGPLLLSKYPDTWHKELFKLGAVL